MILDYLGINRFRYTSPFRLLLVTTTLAILTLNYVLDPALGISKDFTEGLKQGGSSDSALITENIRRFSNLLLWIYIPVLAGLTRVLNYKGQLNFAEHLVFVTYLYCISNIITLLMMIDAWTGLPVFSILAFPLFVLYFGLAYRQIFKKSWRRVLLELLLIIALSLLIYFFVVAAFLGFMSGLSA